LPDDPSDRSPSLETLYWECSVLDTPQKRNEWLKQRCPNEFALHAKVEHMFDVEADADRFAEAFFPMVDLEEKRDPLGQTIGPYKLLQEIGRGGMGVVYMAEQSTPVARRVALKVVKPGMDSDEVVARFEVERQTLAMMDHPNIAKVLDAGQTVTGHPYFVMELIQGLPITDYADEQRLGLRQRIELVIQACRGIQHAHQKGIIHRDIKPSNVLVSLHDEQPIVKIIDFGVAKALDYRLNDRTLFTRFGQVVGTLEYMSPEQAQWNQLDIDTRTDVYAVGVLLYELLTGKPPLDATRVRSAAFEEVLRLIREEEPIRPSLKLSTSRRAARLDRDGQEPTNQFASLVRGELDWITIKALAKNRDQRYDSVTALADDLQRFLAQEPVHACPPSNWYRWKKACQRHRTLVWVTSLVLLGLIGITLSTLIQNQRVRAANERVNRLLLSEQQARMETSQLNEFLLNFFKKPHPDVDGREIKVVDLLRPASLDLLNDESEPSITNATFCETLGRTFLALNLSVEARQLFEKSASMREQLFGMNAPETLRAKFLIGLARLDTNEVQAGVDLLREILSKQRELLGVAHGDTLDTQRHLGTVLVSEHNDPEGLELLRDVVAQRRALTGATSQETMDATSFLADALLTLDRAPDAELLLVDLVGQIPEDSDRKTLKTKATSLMQMSHVHFMQMRYDDAISCNELALSILRRVCTPSDPTLLISLHNAGVMLAEVGKYDQALALSREALALHERVFGPDRPETIESRGVHTGMLTYAGNLEEAIALAEKNRDLAEDVLGPTHKITLECLVKLGIAYRTAGRTSDAIQAFEKAWQQFRETEWNESLRFVNCAGQLVELLADTDRISEVKHIVETLTPSSTVGRSEAWCVALGELYLLPIEVWIRKGELDEANHLLDKLRSVVSTMNKGSPGSELFDHAALQLGIAFFEGSRLLEAERLVRDTVARREGIAYFNAIHTLGKILAKQGGNEEAERLLREAAEGYLSMRQQIPLEHRRKAIEAAIQDVVEFYRTRGDHESLRTWEENLENVRAEFLNEDRSSEANLDNAPTETPR